MSSPSTANRPSAVGVGLLGAFFLSGAAALVYQVLWTRRLSLAFGVTVYAASTVLAVFMAGLAIGSYIAGRVADRVERPVRVFALVELLIAVTALITPYALHGVESLYVGLAPSLHDSQLLKTLVRGLLSALALIGPAILMGSTYPLLLRAASRTATGLSTSAAMLYGVNTAGAIAGTLAGSLWLVPALGMQKAFIAAAGINVTVAAVAWIFGRHLGAGSGEAASAADSVATVAPPSDGARRAVLIVMMLSGAVSLALEIIWFRILVFFLRPTTYAFASMLAAVLLGMAAGSLIITPLLKRRVNWVFALGILEALIAIMALTSLYGIVRSYDLMELMWKWTWMPAPYDYVLPLLGSAAVALLPTSLLLGAAFPIGVVLWSAGDQTRMRRRIGTLYATNVAGAIVGSLAAGFVLVPMLGARASLILIAAPPMLGAVALFLTSGAKTARTAAVGAVVLFAATAVTVPDVFRDVVARRYDNQKILWHSEDAQTTVDVTQEGGSHQLLIDGMHHATDRDGEVTLHRAIGLLGLAVQPSPGRILVVGMGGGATAGAASIMPGSVTQVVELSPSVVAAGAWFKNANHNVLENPSVKFRIDDGRNFLLTTNRKFDVITADLILPHLAGAGNLYSRDYFELARRSLTPTGVMVQWIAADTEYQYKMMLRTFASVFPYVTLWVDHQLAVGSNQPLDLREEDFDRKMLSPETHGAFVANGITDFKTLLSVYSAGTKEVRDYVGDGPILTDDLPIIEYFLSMPKGGPAPDQRQMKGNVADVYKGPIKKDQP